ncbi:MAG TPA: macro domain-containing protein [Aliidongia sp.]|nr:macro domain-containing protein [Aliidongia sp.]
MTLMFKNGDMFAEPVEALVNTVNCVGVMGKGVALEFKRRWPGNFRAYKNACDMKALNPGTMLVFDTHRLFPSDGPRYLVNFPTKTHWRSPSKLAYIEQGLDALVREIRDHGIISIALPPLGCGNGGLEWADVKPLIASKLASLDGVEVIVFEPKVSLDVPEFAQQSTLVMNFERAMLLKSLAELELYFDGAFDRLSMQKIIYFLQTLGVGFRLKFERNLYGPYSETLKKAFVIFEKHGMINGFLTNDRRAHVTPIGCAAADDFLQDCERPVEDIITRLSHLIQGYESPYGLELLSSVHWLAHHEKQYPIEKIIKAMNGWNDRKRNTFDDNTIRAAYQRLQEDGLLTDRNVRG